jgi:uncharacterized protein
MNNLYGKTAIVTGATGGIGREVCRKLYDAGAVVIGINKDVNKKADFIHQQFSLDMSSYQDLHTIYNEILQLYGVPDYLIFCSGCLIPANYTKLSHDEIKTVINSNLISLINISKIMIPSMEILQRGHLLIVGSLGGIVPMPYSALYSSMKFAVRGFCLSLAEELKDSGIKISHLAPGPVKTTMLDTEAMDDNSTVSFIQKPLHPGVVADKIMSLIRQPRLEVLIPSSGKLTAFIFNLFPALFLKCFFLLKRSGSRGMKKYRLDLLSKSIM